MASPRSNHDPEGMKARLNALMAVFGPELGSRTPTEFARELDIQPSTWANYVRDGMRPQLDHAYKLKSRFGVDLDWIYQGETDQLSVTLAKKLQAALDEASPAPQSRRA